MADQKITQLTNYTPAIDTDVMPIVDITNTATKKITWANIKATLKTYFDTIYSANTSALGTGIVKSTTGTGALTIATGADLPTMTATVGGAVPTPPNNTTTYLRGDGTFGTPAGSGDMVLASAQTNSGLKTFLDATFGLRNVANTFTSLFTNTNTAARTYTLKDASGTVAFTSDITGTNSGTNTGDQTITLTGAVTGSGTGSFATTFATPGTLSQSSSNSNATAHTHAITTATAPTASTITAFDANKNLTGNNVITSFTTTATAAGTTTMAVGDTYQQVWTGSTTQTVKLPTTSVAQGQQFNISNQSTGNVTVQSSGANQIVILGAGMSATFTAQVATPTTAANWGYVLSEYIGLNNAITASSNAATINLAYKTNTVTNNSAATLTVTIPTAGAIDRETRILQILPSSAVAQTLTMVNTENSVISSVPATTGASTTIPITISFIYNAGTSKWTCVGNS